MLSALRPLGALLAALALWAVGLLVLALGGLGGRVGVHPEDASLAPPIPQVTLTAVGSRLGPATDYLEVGNRPLLTADRRPAPVTAAGSDHSEAPLDVVLTSVLIAGDTRLAIVQRKDDSISRRVRIGDVVEGTAWRLVEIAPRRAVFEGPQGRRELELRVFDGTGGQAPSVPAVATAPPPDPQQPPATAPVPVLPGLGGAMAGREEAVQMTPEQQVEAIRRRIEARRAMRAAEGAEERAALERAKQVE